MNSYILTRPKLKFEFKDGDEKIYSLKKPLLFVYKDKTYAINPIENNETFMTNLASVPFYLRWLHRTNSKQTLYASIIHDKLYSIRGTSRYQDDLVFLTLTKSEQLYYLKDEKFYKKPFISLRYFFIRWSLFIVLRLFGWLNKA